jgi:hypothetical protein
MQLAMTLLRVRGVLLVCAVVVHEESQSEKRQRIQLTVAAMMVKHMMRKHERVCGAGEMFASGQCFAGSGQ